jgi:prophage regulatory protein
MNDESSTRMQILRRPQVEKMVGLSRSTIYLLVSRDEFPRPIELGSRAVGWLEDEVEAWIQSRARLSRKGHASASLRPVSVPNFAESQ